MSEPILSGAEKVALRARGQLMEPSLKVGREGLTPTFFVELDRQLKAHELVKLRFLGADRHEREAFCERIAEEGKCACVGAVGHTALFWRKASVSAKATP